MDAARFDQLAQTLASASRRRLLGVLAALPVLGGLFDLAGEEDADARGRRKRRKKRHKHGKGRRRKNRRGKRRCRPESVAQTCAGTCGSVRNNCRKTVGCGSCACDPACATCFTCQELPETPGSCVVDPAQQGQTCGDPGQVCQPDGSCACDANSCSNPAPICDSGVCLTCGDSNACMAAGLGDLCCGGSCFSGVCCTDDACAGDAAAPDCIDHACVCATHSNTPCASEETCCAAGCVDLQWEAANCGSCGHVCPSATEICVNGACQACDVCAEAGCVATVQAAITAATSGDTIYICAGTYARQGTDIVANSENKDLTLIGAGTGENGTILDGGGVDVSKPVLVAFGSEVELRALVVTGANGYAGILNSGSTLTLTDVLVTGNDGALGGGIESDGAVVLNVGARVTGNHAQLGGGGVANGVGAMLTLNAGSSVSSNTASAGAAGIRNRGTVIANPGSVVEDCVNVLEGTGCPA